MDIRHCIHMDDMDNLLFDDKDTVKSCLKCRRNNGINRLTHSNDSLSPSSKKFIYLDDQIDNAEDSPLLINDCLAETQIESNFHCHAALSISEDKKALKKLIFATVFCLIFMIAEVVGGYFAGSLAIMTDAAHLFSDLVGFLISILAICLAKKSPTKFMTFGYFRAEVLGAFLSVFTIWILAAVFVFLAFKRIYNEEYNIDANTMIIVASAGLLVNIIMGAILHGGCGHHHHDEEDPTQNHDNINVRAAAAHVLGDLVQSCGVLIAAAIIKIFPNAQAADPICTLIFSVIIIFTTTKIARDSIWMLMQGSPIERDKVVTELKNIPNVKHVHDVNIWSLAPGKNIVTAHLAVDEFCDKECIIQTATSSVKNQVGIHSCTIQVENYNTIDIDVCKICQIRECIC